MQPKTILVIASTFPRWPNDSRPSFVYELAKTQAKTLNIIVLAPYSKGAKVYEEDSGLKIYRFKYWFEGDNNLADGGILPNLKKNPLLYIQILPFIISEFLSALKIIRKENIQAIHAHWIIPQGFVALMLKKILRLNFIVTSLGGDMFPFTSHNLLLLWLYRQIISQASFVTTVNKAFVSTLDLCGDHKTFYIPNAIDLTKFKSKPQFRKNTNLLFVGRLVEKKGAEYLLQALSHLNNNLYHQLLLVGEGPQKTNLEKTVKLQHLQHKVIFLGNVPYDKLRELYYSSLLLVVPSISPQNGDVEGFPTVYLDAMASGCPILTTAITGIETIFKSGENSLIVPQKNPLALATALEELITNHRLRNTLLQNAFYEVRRKYSLETVNRQYYKLISQL